MGIFGWVFDGVGLATGNGGRWLVTRRLYCLVCMCIVAQLNFSGLDVFVVCVLARIIAMID